MIFSGPWSYRKKPHLPKSNLQDFILHISRIPDFSTWVFFFLRSGKAGHGVTPNPRFAELPLAFLKGKSLPRAPGSGEGCAKGSREATRKYSGALRVFKSCSETQRGCLELQIRPEWMQ